MGQATAGSHHAPGLSPLLLFRLVQRQLAQALRLALPGVLLSLHVGVAWHVNGHLTPWPRRAPRAHGMPGAGFHFLADLTTCPLTDPSLSRGDDITSIVLALWHVRLLSLWANCRGCA